MRTLAERLPEKLADWRPEGGRQALEVSDPEGGWTASVTADHVEVLGARLWEVALRRDGAPAPADLKARAGQVAARATGLLENLRLLEVDPAQDVALLRSEAPGQWGEGRFYYEVVLRGAGATTVRRYQSAAAGQPRQQVPFTLTHEALGKLVRDLTGV
jgi:hypothetical protein